MTKYLSRETYKNMVVDAVETNGKYIVRAFRNGKLYNSYEAESLEDAQAAYSATVYGMYR
jgi:hypothetical protein